MGPIDWWFRKYFLLFLTLGINLKRYLIISFICTYITIPPMQIISYDTIRDDQQVLTTTKP